MQRAARFYYLQKLSFAGRNWSRAFRTKVDGPPQLNLLRLEEELSQVHLRLARVQVENLPWAKVIERYDREHTFFYLDPPYYGVEDYYGKGLFERAAYEETASRRRHPSWPVLSGAPGAPRSRHRGGTSGSRRSARGGACPSPRRPPPGAHRRAPRRSRRARLRAR